MKPVSLTLLTVFLPANWQSISLYLTTKYFRPIGELKNKYGESSMKASDDRPVEPVNTKDENECELILTLLGSYGTNGADLSEFKSKCEMEI